MVSEYRCGKGSVRHDKDPLKVPGSLTLTFLNRVMYTSISSILPSYNTLLSLITTLRIIHHDAGSKVLIGRLSTTCDQRT